MNITQAITKLKNDKDYAALKKINEEENFEKVLDLQNRIAKKFLKTEYYPYEKKVILCENIVDFTMTKTDEKGNKSFYINSPMRQMLLVLKMLDVYIVDVDFSEGAQTFNLLQIDKDAQFLFGLIPQSEREIFIDIIDMAEEDYRENYRSTPAYIDGKIDVFKLVLDKLLDVFAENPQLSEIVSKLNTKNSSN